MTYDTLIYDVADGVATITLNRPDAANALNLELARELFTASLAADADPAVRTVLITGAGRMFCAGGDLRSFAAAGENLPAHLQEVTTYLHSAIARFTRMDAPLVVAVNGVAAGAGMSMALAGDLVLAGEAARFTMAYTRAGLVPDGSSTYFLPRVVGLKRAIELTLTNRMLSAAEAVDWGIATRVVADAELMTEASTLARELASGPTGAFGASTRLLHRSIDDRLETQMELEARAIAAQSVTADGREGIAAFLEKRPPAFEGN